MTEKQHKTYFLIFLISCALLILILDAPIRNYIPIIWGILGFGLYGYLFWKTWLDLSRKLITENKSELKEMKISFYDNQYKKAVDMFALFQEKQKIESISEDIKTRLSYYITFFRLTLIAFLMFVSLGILTIVMTWN